MDHGPSRLLSVFVVSRRPGHRQKPKESTVFIVGTGREEQLAWVAIVPGLAELDCPEPFDAQRRAACGMQGPTVLVGPVRLQRERVDAAVAEIADEQLTTELAELVRRPGQAPG